MTRFTRSLQVGAALTALACGDIGAPIRDELYEWRIETPAIPGPGVDTLSFHWGKDRLPVRVWVEDAFELPAHMARAIEVWQSAFLYGEFAGTLVGDSSAADVIVRAGSPDPKLQRLRLHSALAPVCIGFTDLDIDVPSRELRLPIRVFVNPSLPDDPGLQRCLAFTSIHEMGHALGILVHSDDRADIMYVLPEVDLPSDRDIRTAEAAYHIPATLQAVGP